MWVTLHIEEPLEVEAADREPFFRPHPDNLHSAFPSFEIEAAVKSACNTILTQAREELTRQLRNAQPKQKHGPHQTGIYLNALVAFVNWSRPSSESAEPNTEMRSTEWNPVA